MAGSLRKYHEDGRECGRTEAEVTSPDGGVQTLRSDCGEGSRGRDDALSTAASYKVYRAASVSQECLNEMDHRGD